MFQNANCARFYNVQFELCERLESVQRASDLPAFPRRAESELRPNTWAFHMSSVISTTLQLPFTPPFGLIILASLSVLLSCCVHHPPPPPVRAHTFSLKLRVSLSAVCIASSVITGASLLARCSGYPCRHGCIQTFLWFFSKMIGWETAIPDILEQRRSQNGFKILLDKKILLEYFSHSNFKLLNVQ